MSFSKSFVVLLNCFCFLMSTVNQKPVLSESDSCSSAQAHDPSLRLRRGVRVCGSGHRHSGLGRSSFSKLGRLEKKGANITRPRDQRPGGGRTNRYNENDGMSTLVHELAFGIAICFGSEGYNLQWQLTVPLGEPRKKGPVRRHLFVTAGPSESIAEYSTRSSGKSRPTRGNRDCPVPVPV